MINKQYYIIYNTYQIMNIKIEFRGKLYLLPKEITTVQKIIVNIKERYKGYFKCGVKLGVVTNNSLFQINSDSDLQSIKAKNDGNTLKIKAIEIEESFSNILPQIKKSIDLTENNLNVSKVQSSFKVIIQQQTIKKIEETPKQINLKQSTKIQSKEKEIQKILIIQKIEEKPLKSDISGKKSYKCYKCNGGQSLKIKNNKIKTCSLCFGQKVITQNNPIMPFLTEFITDKVKQILESMKNDLKEEKKESMKNDLKEEKKVIKLQETKQIIKQKTNNTFKMDNLYNFSFLKAPQNKIKSNKGKVYFWCLYMCNNGQQNWPETCRVYKILPNNIQSVFEFKGIQPSSSVELNLSFDALKDNAIELHEFRLGYTNQLNEKIFFGPKFGYELDTTIQKKIDQISNNQSVLREMIKKACFKCSNGKRINPDGIYNKVKELGFDHTISNQLLYEIINHN